MGINVRENFKGQLGYYGIGRRLKRYHEFRGLDINIVGNRSGWQSFKKWKNDNEYRHFFFRVDEIFLRKILG